MDENDPVACLPFLNPEASDQGRVVIVKNQNHRKNQNRLSPRSLLVACVKLVDDYNCEALPDIAPEDHATILMPRLNASHPHDQTFLTQVLYGCCRYKKLLDVLTRKLFSCKSPHIQCVNETLYTVLGYLALMRLEELTFANFSKFVLSQHPLKLLPFMQFVFSQEDLVNFCKPEWITLYDAEYVDAIIERLNTWKIQADELSKRLEDKIILIKHQNKCSTACKPFNLSVPAKKIAEVIEGDEKTHQAKPFKAKPPPNWRKGPTPAQKALEATCKESRKKLDKFYADPKNQPFHLRSLERPSKFSAIKEQIEAVRSLETKYMVPKFHPCPEPPETEVKLTTAVVLREHALYQKQLQEERRRLEAFEMELRDDSDYRSWKEEMKSRDQLLEDAYKKFRKASVDACDQAAIEAKNAKAQENRDIVKKVKEESQKYDALKYEFFVNLELFNRLRKENIVEGEKAVKLASEKMAEAKKERAREIQAESAKFTSITANERAMELAKKREIIQQLHSLEAESIHIMKKFDRNSTAGYGLLGEMCISELQERLTLVKEAIKKEEEYRRIRITALKEEQQNKILQKSAFVKRMRELGRVQRIAKKDDKFR